MKLADICIRQSHYSKAVQIVDALFVKVSLAGVNLFTVSLWRDGEDCLDN